MKSNRFEDFVLARGIPVDDVMMPADRLLMSLGWIEKPVGMFSFWKRSLFLSAAFAVVSLVIEEIGFRVVFNTSVFTASMPNLCLIGVMLVSFGPMLTLAYQRQIEPYKAELANFDQPVARPEPS